MITIKNIKTMKNDVYFINPATDEKVKAETQAEIKKYTSCGWRRVKKVVHYDFTGKKIN